MTMRDVEIMCIAVGLAGAVAYAGSAAAVSERGGRSETASHTVRGDVLDIEGEFYFIKDVSGHEIRLHVNKDTQMADRVKVGDKIEAHVTSDGHVTSLRVQLPEDRPFSGESPLP